MFRFLMLKENNQAYILLIENRVVLVYKKFHRSVINHVKFASVEGDNQPVFPRGSSDFHVELTIKLDLRK